MKTVYALTLFLVAVSYQSTLLDGKPVLRSSPTSSVTSLPQLQSSARTTQSAYSDVGGHVIDVEERGRARQRASSRDRHDLDALRQELNVETSEIDGGDAVKVTMPFHVPGEFNALTNGDHVNGDLLDDIATKLNVHSPVRADMRIPKHVLQKALSRHVNVSTLMSTLFNVLLTMAAMLSMMTTGNVAIVLSYYLFFYVIGVHLTFKAMQYVAKRHGKTNLAHFSSVNKWRHLGLSNNKVHGDIAQNMLTRADVSVDDFEEVLKENNVGLNVWAIERLAKPYYRREVAFSEYDEFIDKREEPKEDIMKTLYLDTVLDKHFEHHSIPLFVKSIWPLALVNAIYTIREEGLTMKSLMPIVALLIASRDVLRVMSAAPTPQKSQQDEGSIDEQATLLPKYKGDIFGLVAEAEALAITAGEVPNRMYQEYMLRKTLERTLPPKGLSRSPVRFVAPK